MERPMVDTDRKRDSILTGIAALLFLYVAVRAYLLAITWDEAYTYIEFARNGKVFLDKYDMMSANNHILNTAGMILFTKLFGLSEFVMRIPVMLAYIIFLFYSAKLVRGLGNRWYAVGAFLVLNVNPYMIDFFSMARGYGLSLGLMMGSIYFFYLFHFNENRSRNAFISVLFASLAVFANFVLLNYFVVLTGVLVVLSFYFASPGPADKRERIPAAIRMIAMPLLLAAIVFFIVIPIATGLKGAGALFFGGEQNFWSDTISTITDRCFYELGYSYWLQRMAKGFVFLILILSSGYFIQRMLKKKMDAQSLFLGSLLALLGLCSLSTVVQHHLMQTPYLLDRTALFLVVLFNLIFVFFIGNFSKERKQMIYIIYSSALVLLAHFFMCFNLIYVLEWKYDCNTKEMLADVEQMKNIPEGKETISIGIPLIFDPAMNFYREKNNLTWLNTAWRAYTNSMQHDYFCLAQKDFPEFNMDSIVIIKTYPVTGNVLAKPKFPVKKIRAAIEKTITFENESGGRFLVDSLVEYAPGFSYIVNDSVTPVKTGVFAFYAEVNSPDLKKNNLVMVISFQDSKGNLYSWQKAYVKDFMKNEEDVFRANFTCVLPPQVKAGDEVKAYIWNPDKHTLKIRKQEFKWLEYHY
jgi:hypothetical protein